MLFYSLQVSNYASNNLMNIVYTIVMTIRHSHKTEVRRLHITEGQNPSGTKCILVHIPIVVHISCNICTYCIPASFQRNRRCCCSAATLTGDSGRAAPNLLIRRTQTPRGAASGRV